MVGLGAGARSYTSALHYCTEYAVGRAGIRAILNDFIDRPASDHALAWYGCELTPPEQRRRYLIKSLLRADGLDAAAYATWSSGSSWQEDFPILQELLDAGLAEDDGRALRLNASGMECADTIGPWLYSDEMNRRMEEYELV